MTLRTLSTDDLARSLHMPCASVEALLEESVLSGVVEKTPAGWRLSQWAERRFGAALRSLKESL